jgi:hypothetical protein
MLRIKWLSQKNQSQKRLKAKLTTKKPRLGLNVISAPTATSMGLWLAAFRVFYPRPCLFFPPPPDPLPQVEGERTAP